MAKTYEKEYLKTLKSMDAETLTGYMKKYIKKALELQEQLASVISEIKMMQDILSETVRKETVSKKEEK